MYWYERKKHGIARAAEETQVSIWTDRWIMAYFCCLAFVLGTVFGSFLNCAAWRSSRGESFLRGRSSCPACGHDLGARDLVPVLSWLFQRGRCRYCGAGISVRYPLTELSFGALTLLCLLRFDLSVLCLRNWIFLCCLFFLSLVDLETQIIPDGSLILAALAWLLTLPLLHTGPKAALLRLLAGIVFAAALLLLSLLMDRLLKKDSLGGGDIKLFAVVGLYLGFVGTLFALMIACVAGLLFAAVLFKNNMKGRAFPFGPAISFAAAFMLLFGSGLTDWYLGLLGL
jgi:leader peptidase (prepilin peptidase)/N-methyltransferase